MPVALGARAPDFTLSGTTGAPDGRRTFALNDYLGQPVVLVFYPADDSLVCTRQLNAYTSDIADFEALGAQVLALSPQSVERHEAFAEAQGGFAFPLLADEEKAVGKLYDILGPLGFYRRSIVVIDAEGVVRWTHRSLTGATFRPTDQLVAELRKL